MRSELLNFKISPAIVQADKISEISIEGTSEYYRFWDDVEYTVILCPKEYHDTEIDEDFTLGQFGYNQLKVKPENGILRFSYLFIEEQEWEIVVQASPEQKKHLNSIRHSYAGVWNLAEMERGKNFRIYSLKEDLYNRRVFKGDMHLHSHYSDGCENPETIISNMRRHGYDYCAVTDHHYYASSVEAKEKLSQLDTGFTAFLGEEVHNKILGRFHIVNFGGKYSVNEKILSDREAYKAKVAKAAEGLDGLSGRDAEEVAWYKCITEDIRESGGLSIYAHPYWSVSNAYNCPTHITREVLKRGYFDAYEVLGGCSIHENNLAVALYNDLRAEGVKIPIVGSTDCHYTQNKGESGCSKAQTLVFADNAEDIPSAICELYSVAVETIKGETERVYGSFRLTKYAIFLLENYYPLHDRLCAASGALMSEYFAGAKEVKSAVEIAEKHITALEKRFFGK